jgi:hypothetical protein
MPVIQHRRQDYLLDRKIRLLEDIAHADIESGLPPTDRMPRNVAAALEEIPQIDAELTAMGFNADYGFAVCMADGLWEADRADEEAS